MRGLLHGFPSLSDQQSLRHLRIYMKTLIGVLPSWSAFACTFPADWQALPPLLSINVGNSCTSFEKGVGADWYEPASSQFSIYITQMLCADTRKNFSGAFCCTIHNFFSPEAGRHNSPQFLTSATVFAWLMGPKGRRPTWLKRFSLKLKPGEFEKAFSRQNWRTKTDRVCREWLRNKISLSQKIFRVHKHNQACAASTHNYCSLFCNQSLFNFTTRLALNLMSAYSRFVWTTMKDFQLKLCKLCFPARP